MIDKCLLVDFENVQQVNLDLLDSSYSVKIFVGASQKNISLDLVKKAQSFGSRLQWQKIEGNGKNALDFHIAMQLGRFLENPKKFECIVLSKGFDPLIRHLNQEGLRCKRFNSMLELGSAPVSTDNPNYQRVLEILKKSEKRHRPRRRKTLTQHVSAIFQKKIKEAEVNEIVDILFARNHISETNNIISYDF
ncbi:MAG: PIN domain-containing protein [Methylotenera sp.]